MKKAVSEIVVELDNRYHKQLIKLAKDLMPYLPESAILAIDCMPRERKLNAFHYVDGRDDLKTLFSLQGEKEKLKGLMQKTRRFQINYQAGMKIGLWAQLDFFKYEEQINWDEAFIIKKASGEMVIHDPVLIEKRAKGKISVDSLRLRGINTKVQIVKFLHRPGANFHQRYYEPLCGPQESHRVCSYRFLLCLQEKETVELLGGIWTSTKQDASRLKGVDEIRIGLIR